jgi:hypothetical protein
MLEQLGVDGMSSDESEAEDGASKLLFCVFV